MKNKETDSIFRRKGFFIGLYSCLGAVAVLALVITFAARNNGYDPYGEDVAPVGADLVLPYQQQQAQADQEAWFRPRATPTPPPVPTPVPPQATPPVQPTPPPTPVPRAEPPPTSPELNAAPPEPTPAPPPPEAYVPEVIIPATFEPFAETDKMLWPVDGEIVMDFDLYTLVFDPTLQRFAVNTDIRINAQEGTPVRAGADGRVMAIGNSVEWGNYVKVDHGNGWTARYGQLMDALMVREGDVIRTGQVLGGVGQPSYFGTMLGTHFNFQVTRNDEVINPHTVLVERRD